MRISTPPKYIVCSDLPAAAILVRSHLPCSQIPPSNPSQWKISTPLPEPATLSRVKIFKWKRLEQRAKVAPREPLLLVDASAYIFRAYYSMPPLRGEL
ncbi:hypothetical protein ScalyP_jg11598 [Parmales sp. scaly parma]|nr:hypothetical protein ScalyP_jg11598 [Parmales sp. scaly parma]